MDSAPPSGPNVVPGSADELPPEAIALATRFFNAAREGQMDIFEQGLAAGLPANMTNEKGDSLVSLRGVCVFKEFRWVWRGWGGRGAKGGQVSSRRGLSLLWDEITSVDRCGIGGHGAQQDKC